MSDFVEQRWENGVDHHPEAIGLVKKINKLDTESLLDFKTGGDGDIGETVAYFLDELIDRGIISITIHAK